ncbi:MAG: hypothetical protein H5U00_04480 [Clostridia bacterium]|nr:hypothetical protein [Clostridia bacterium]
MHFDRTLIDQPEKPGQVFHQEIIDHLAAAGGGQGYGGEPGGGVSGAFLLVERVPFNAFRVAAHHHGAAGEVREEVRTHRGVVMQKVRFGVAFLRPEDLFQVAQHHFLFFGAHDDFLFHPAFSPC